MSEHSGLTSIAERRRIVARVHEMFSEIDESEAALERARQGLDAGVAELVRLELSSREHRSRSSIR